MSPVLSTFSGASARAFGFGYNFAASAFEHIETQTVGAGGVASITFSSIPQTYKHLQIRGILRSNRASYSVDNGKMIFNSDTATNYSHHYISGGYTTTPQATSGAGSTTSYIQLVNSAIPTTVVTGVWGGLVIDVLDYVSTTKHKTTRALFGYDINGTAGLDSYGGGIQLGSGLWRSTSAITAINIAPLSGTLFTEYSELRLYGIK